MLTKHHAMKTYDVEAQNHSFLTLTMEWSASRLTFGENAPGTQWTLNLFCSSDLAQLGITKYRVFNLKATLTTTVFLSLGDINMTKQVVLQFLLRRTHRKALQHMLKTSTTLNTNIHSFPRFPRNSKECFGVSVGYRLFNTLFHVLRASWIFRTNSRQ
jgi:hypothetical protein